MGKYGDLMKVYKFGDIPVGVETRGVYFNDNCINYLAEKAKPEFVIKATDKEFGIRTECSQKMIRLILNPIWNL